jgi:hypothetical protein
MKRSAVIAMLLLVACAGEAPPTQHDSLDKAPAAAAPEPARVSAGDTPASPPAPAPPAPAAAVTDPPLAAPAPPPPRPPAAPQTPAGEPSSAAPEPPEPEPQPFLEPKPQASPAAPPPTVIQGTAIPGLRILPLGGDPDAGCDPEVVEIVEQPPCADGAGGTGP